MCNIEEKIKEALRELELVISTVCSGYSTSDFKVQLQYRGEVITEAYIDGYDIKEIISE